VVLGYGLWPPTPNPQSPIPNPQSPIPNWLFIFYNYFIFINKNIYWILKFKLPISILNKNE